MQDADYLYCLVFLLFSLAFCLGLPLILGLLVWLGRRRGRAQMNPVDESLRNFAQLNRLTYTPGSWSLRAIARHRAGWPSVTGEYRGRHLIMEMGFQTSTDWVGDAMTVGETSLTTIVSLSVKNLAGCSLDVREKGQLAEMFARGKDSFTMKGHPREFVQRVQPLIRPLFEGPAPKCPYINLKGSKLIWQHRQHVVDMSELNELLDLLFNLAELVESTESPVIAPSR